MQAPKTLRCTLPLVALSLSACLFGPRKPKSPSELSFGPPAQLSAPSIALPAQNPAEEQNPEAAARWQELSVIEKNPSASPKERASAWCALAAIPEPNPYLQEAQEGCAAWTDYNKQYTALLTAMRTDYEALASYLVLEEKSTDQKWAATEAYLTTYAPLADREEYLQVKAARDAFSRGEPYSLKDIAEIPGPLLALEGTTWKGPDSDGDVYTFYFKPDGVLFYENANGRFGDSSWRWEDDKIFLSLNRGFAEYEGEISGERMEGSAKNKSGDTWTWTASLVDPSLPITLEGTVWQGGDSDGDMYTYYFQPDGKLFYKAPGIGLSKNGTWRQEGEKVFFEMNNRYAEYEGVIQGNRIEGKAKNKEGHTWTWYAIHE